MSNRDEVEVMICIGPAHLVRSTAQFAMDGMKRALEAVCSGSETGPADAALALCDAIQCFEPTLKAIRGENGPPPPKSP